MSTLLPQRNWIREAWDRLQPLPGGTQLYSFALARLVPYTATAGLQIVELSPGCAEVRMPDRRRVRNHLRSIHAIAIANLAELCGSLALAYALPARLRFIITGVDMRYLRKARGALTAQASAPVVEQEAEVEAVVDVLDVGRRSVAQATIHIRVGCR